MSDQLVTLLPGVTVDTDGDAILITPPDHLWQEAVFTVFVWSANFGGGSVFIQVSPNGSQWFTARSRNDNRALFTASDHMVIWLRAPYVRARLTGSTTPSAVWAQVVLVGNASRPAT